MRAIKTNNHQPAELVKGVTVLNIHIYKQTYNAIWCRQYTKWNFILFYIKEYFYTGVFVCVCVFVFCQEGSHFWISPHTIHRKKSFSSIHLHLDKLINTLYNIAINGGWKEIVNIEWSMRSKERRIETGGLKKGSFVFKCLLHCVIYENFAHLSVLQRYTLPYVLCGE